MSACNTRTVLCVVGARPNFMKIAPIMRALDRYDGMRGVLLHTGQHYDEAMNAQFFEQLRIPRPDITLEVGSGTHAWQTAQIMQRFEPVLDEWAPDCVLVVGDVNSTIATALVACKKGFKVVHVEAGLRSRDRTMPEEVNRVLTDSISDRLYITEEDARRNLLAEGIAEERIVFAGNVMIDSMVAGQDDVQRPADTLAAHGVRMAEVVGDGRFGVLTLHRPSNVDDFETLAPLLGVLAEVSQRLPLLFTVHPRTREKLHLHGLEDFLQRPGIIALPPLGYREMQGLIRDARLVLTDSGGLQEETTALGVPCLTLRENTERPVTIEQGTNFLVGLDPARIMEHAERAIVAERRPTRRPDGWDGHAAERIVEDLFHWLA